MVEVGGTVDGEDVVSEIHRFGLVLLLLEVLAGENASNGGTRHGDDLGHRLRLDSGIGLVSERRVEADASFCDRRCDAKRGVGAFCERARRGSALRCRRRFSQTDVGRQNKGPLGLFGKNVSGAGQTGEWVVEKRTTRSILVDNSPPTFGGFGVKQSMPNGF
jgi:hypothetical protein